MRCPACEHPESRVLRKELRHDGEDDYIARRRECLECGHRWSTFECFELADVESAFLIRDVLKDIDSIRAKLEPPQSAAEIPS